MVLIDIFARCFAKKEQRRRSGNGRRDATVCTKVRNKTIMQHSRLAGALLCAAAIGTILATAPTAVAAPAPAAPALAERADDGAALL